MKWLKIFDVNFPRSLVYMLQSTEYNPREYLKWFWRVDDFSKVEYRKNLDLTKKARFLLLAVWIMAALQFVGVVVVLLLSSSWSGWMIAMGWLLLIPVLSAHGLVVMLYVGKTLIQGPQEQNLLLIAKQKFSDFTGTKMVVLGSYGKTTTKEVLAKVLSEKLNVKSTIGNLNTPLALAEFANSIDGAEDLLIIELGEYKPGDIAEFADLVMPDMAIVTGLNEAHLETLGSIEASAENLLSIKDYVSSDNLFVNTSSPKLAKFSKNIKSEKYNDKKVLGWSISDISTDIEGTSFKFKKGKKEIRMQSKLLGSHSIPTMALAAALALDNGSSTKSVKKIMKQVEPFEHRFSPYKLGGATVIDDTYNGNIDGFNAGIDFVAGLDGFVRKIYVTPGLVELKDKRSKIHKDIGARAAPVFDVIALMKNKNLPLIKKGLNKAKFKGDIIEITDPLDFYNNLDNFVSSGDLVLMQNDLTDNYE